MSAMEETKSQRKCATEGNEEVAKENYLVIRSIAKKAAKEFSLTMDEVIEFMTSGQSFLDKPSKGLRAGSFNNYCRSGKVSEYTCDTLYKFFDREIPNSVFTGAKKISLKNSADLYGALMEKLNVAKPTINRFIHTEGDKIVRFSNKQDFAFAFEKTLKNIIGYDFDSSEGIDSSAVEKVILRFEKEKQEDDECEDFNAFYFEYIENQVYELEKFIKYVSFEKLYTLDFSILKQLNEYSKKISDIYDAVFKIREIQENMLSM